MAEGNNVICRFFATTGCREGDKCSFSHDRSNTVHDSVCRFYLMGKCVYGLQCRYNHVRPSTSGVNSKNSRNAKAVSQSKPAEPKVAKTLPNQVSNKTAQGSSNPAPNTNSNWINAPEFIPKTKKSYADTLKSESTSSNKWEKTEPLLCPYFMMGDCSYGDRCKLEHGEICDICNKACLLPFDMEQQRRHREECEKELEENMEISFAVQLSADKTCGICMEVIMEKDVQSERRFGILEKCNHIFCLSCIRKWRQVKRNESQVAENTVDPVMQRACPECRVPSDFITPSQYWVEGEEQKKKLIAAYKEAMSKKPCRYFDQGRGNCPFQGACFYLHAYSDGRIAKMPPPQPRRRQNQSGVMDLADPVYLWDFLNLREDNFMLGEDSDYFYEITDSDDSENMIIIT